MTEEQIQALIKERNNLLESLRRIAAEHMVMRIALDEMNRITARALAALNEVADAG